MAELSVLFRFAPFGFPRPHAAHDIAEVQLLMDALGGVGHVPHLDEVTDGLPVQLSEPLQLDGVEMALTSFHLRHEALGASKDGGDFFLFVASCFPR